MPKLPVHTSYFTVDSHVTQDVSFKTAIALDILRQYYDSVTAGSDESTPVTINGFDGKVSYKDLILSIWMVFSKLYSEYDVDATILPGKHMIGWNGPITTPKITIAMATRLYEQLSSFSSSTQDKNSKYTTIQKWFARNQTSFYGFDSYEALATSNPNLYTWIDEKTSELIELKNNILSYGLVINYDALRYAKTVADLGILADLLIAQNDFYMRFLKALEDVLYLNTSHKYPIRIFAIFGHLFNIYMKIVIHFIKPYHAAYIETQPVVNINNMDAILMTEEIGKKTTKKLVDTVVYRLFDLDRTMLPYDMLHPFRELLKIYKNDIQVY